VAKRSESQPPSMTPLSYQVLLSLADTDRHGYGIIKEVDERTGGAVQLETGTLYTALRRLKDDGLLVVVAEEDRPRDEDRRRKTYRLTERGMEELEAETRRLASLVKVAIEKNVIPSNAF